MELKKDDELFTEITDSVAHQGERCKKGSVAEAYMKELSESLEREFGNGISARDGSKGDVRNTMRWKSNVSFTDVFKDVDHAIAYHLDATKGLIRQFPNPQYTLTFHGDKVDTFEATFDYFKKFDEWPDYRLLASGVSDAYAKLNPKTSKNPLKGLSEKREFAKKKPELERKFIKVMEEEASELHRYIRFLYLWHQKVTGESKPTKGMKELQKTFDTYVKEYDRLK